MFKIGTHVVIDNSEFTGVVVDDDGTTISVRMDVNGGTVQFTDRASVSSIEGTPGMYDGTDPVHAAMLRHARNAGAAVTALEIIRREAKVWLEQYDASDWQAKEKGLAFIEKFADDVLSRVLPA